MLAISFLLPRSKSEMRSSPRAGGQSDQSWQETKTGEKGKKQKKRWKKEKGIEKGCKQKPG